MEKEELEKKVVKLEEREQSRRRSKTIRNCFAIGCIILIFIILFVELGKIG